MWASSEDILLQSLSGISRKRCQAIAETLIDASIRVARKKCSAPRATSLVFLQRSPIPVPSPPAVARQAATWWPVERRKRTKLELVLSPGHPPSCCSNLLSRARGVWPDLPHF